MLDPRKVLASPQLPTLPSVAVRLLDLSRNPESEIKDVIAVIRSDPAITAKILKAANSSYFAVRSEVSSVDRAVQLLGTTVVTSMSMSFSLVEAAMTSGPMAEHYQAYWLQSVVQAVTAETLAEELGHQPACEHFLAALLMDLGRLALLKTAAKDYLPALEKARNDRQPLCAVERDMLGIDHVEIGSKLMEHWKLPQPLIEAARMHHAEVPQLLGIPGGGDAHLARVLAVASAAGELQCATSSGQAMDRLQKLTHGFYGWSESDLEGFLTRARARIERAADLFSVRLDELGDPADLMAQANEHLAQLAMKQHVETTQAMAKQQEIEREKHELEMRNRQLQQQALRDPLTKVYNRNFFAEALDKEVSRCSRCADTIGVIFTDIDHFKKLNDTYGHPFGDEVLKRVAAAYGEVLRNADVLARYGGEEFVILINQPTEKGIEKVAERLRARIESEDVRFGDARVQVTVSVGAAIAVPRRTDPELGKQLVATADEAMYHSKQSGRNRVTIRSLLRDDDRQLLQAVAAKRFSRWLVNRNALDIPTVSRALLQCESRRVRIGELAQSRGWLTALQVEEIVAEQERAKQRFGEAAVALGHLTPDNVAQLLAIQQEDPSLLAAAIARLELLPQSEMESLLHEYQEATSPQLAGA